MNIIIVTPYASPETGACVVRTEYLRKYFKSKNIAVTVAAKARGKHGISTNETKRYSGLFKLFQILLFSKYNLVIAEVPPVADAFFALLLCRLRGKLFVVDERDIFKHSMDLFLKIRRNSFKYKLNYFFEKTIYKKADRIFSVTLRDMEDINKIFNVPTSKIILARNGSDTGMIKFDEPERRQTRDRLKLGKNEPLVLFLGNPGDYEINEFLVNCANEASEKYRAKFLFLVSDDGSKTNQRQLELLNNTVEQLGLKNEIKILKNIAYKDLTPFLSASDVGIVPRTNAYLNSVPAKVYDYLAAGLTVIAKGGKGSEMEYLFKKELKGNFVSDWKNFKKKLFYSLEHINDKKTRNRIRQDVVKNYSRKKSAEIILKGLNSIVKE